MPHMREQTRQKVVAIFFDTSCKAGNERIAGVMDFIATKTKWLPLLIQANLHSPSQLRNVWSRIKPDAAIFQCILPVSLFEGTKPTIPTITIDRFLGDWDFKPTIRIRLDETAIGQTAAQFYLKRGFRHAAYIGTNSPTEMNRSLFRGQAFENGFRKSGGDCQTLHFSKRRPHDDRLLARFLSSLTKPCGIFTYSDNEAAHVIETCGTLGLCVPRQVAVLGVNNDEPLCEAGAVTISSIEPDFRTCGTACAEALDRLFRSRNRHHQVITVGVKRMVERQSTQNTGAAHHLVNIIRNRIAAQYADRLSIDNLTIGSTVSPRTIEMTFRETTGHSIREEIKSTRLKAAAELLRKTALGISEIALRTGLNSPTNFYVLFRKRYGLSPTDWRNAVKRPAETQ